MTDMREVDWQKAVAETNRLQRELDITNADHIALWIEANTIPDEPMSQCASWLACRVVEAHEAEIDRRVAEERVKLLERLRGLSDELEDDFTDAIGDSLDVDWGPRDGARNCVIAFNLTLAKFEKENSDG